MIKLYHVINIGIRLKSNFSLEVKKDMSNVKTCYACQYFQAQDGSVMGNPSCAREAEFAGSMKCPRYAQAACMEAASFHTSYTESDTQEVNSTNFLIYRYYNTLLSIVTSCY